MLSGLLPEDFYPRPPRGGRPEVGVEGLVADKISIHALREEGDRTPCGHRQGRLIFLSTPSARRATSFRCRGGWCTSYFYPRPPRGGRPGRRPEASLATQNFYPRPPRGGRQEAKADDAETEEFLSTPSARRATRRIPRRPTCFRFLSTPSARRATFHDDLLDVVVHISIHALREEGDCR